MYRCMVSIYTRSAAQLLILCLTYCKWEFLRMHGLHAFGINDKIMKALDLWYVSRRAVLVKNCDSECCQYRHMLPVKSPLLRMPFLCVYCHSVTSRIHWSNPLSMPTAALESKYHHPKPGRS